MDRITQIIELAEEFALRNKKLSEDSLTLDIYFSRLNIRLRSDAAKYTEGISSMAYGGVMLIPSLLPVKNKLYLKEAIVRFIFPIAISYKDALYWFSRVDRYVTNMLVSLNDREVDSLDEKAIDMLNNEYEYGGTIYPVDVIDILNDILNRTE